LAPVAKFENLARWLSWIVLQQRDLAPERHPAMYAELGVFTIYGVR
jgi:hypothetical protein